MHLVLNALVNGPWGEEAARLRIYKTNEYHDEELADYSVQMVVNRDGALGSHQAKLERASTRLNSLGLLLAALSIFDERQLYLESSAPDLARQERGALPSVSSQEEGRSSNH